MRPGQSDLEHQLSHSAGICRTRRMANESRDARIAPRAKEVSDTVARSTQRHFIYQFVRHRCNSFFLLACKIEILDLGGCFLVSVPARQIVIKVPAPCAHPAYVQREVRFYSVTAALDIIADHQGNSWSDIEACRGASRTFFEAFLQVFAKDPDAVRREEDRQPAIGQLSGERYILGP